MNDARFAQGSSGNDPGARRGDLEKPITHQTKRLASAELLKQSSLSQTPARILVAPKKAEQDLET